MNFLKTKLLQILVGLFMVGVLNIAMPKPALAFEFVVTNNQAKTMSLAIEYYDDNAQKWLCRGWFNVPSGATKTYNFKESKTVKYGYVYAESGKLRWDGKNSDDAITRTVTNTSFRYYDGDNPPDDPKHYDASFFKFYMCVNGAGLVWGEPKENKPTNTTPKNTTSTAGISAEELEGIRLLNIDRAKNNLPALIPDANLTKVARKHAKDMIAQNYFEHTNLKGQSPFDRLHENGITYMSAGENIAIDYSIPSMQEGWMNSPGHRANILNKNFTHVGLGLATKNDGSIYGVQVFTKY